MESDATYYSRRAAQERAAALESTNIKVQDRHLEFAQAYEYESERWRSWNDAQPSPGEGPLVECEGLDIDCAAGDFLALSSR
jgi:hypothetical protein